MKKKSPEESIELNSRIFTIFLCILCFFAGALIMVIEVAGNKFLAPYFGNSIYTWTSLIGVVLVAVSLGGIFGGWRADRVRSPSFFLISLLILASCFSALAPFFYNFLVSTGKSFSDIIWGPIIFSLILLAFPVFLLGAISPICIKIISSSKSSIDSIGTVAGFVSMSGALGSFLGVFICGFYLIPNYNIRNIFFICAILLFLLALALVFFSKKKVKEKLEKLELNIFLGMVLIFPISCIFVNFILKKEKEKEIIAHFSTTYHEIFVEEQEVANGKFFRALKLDTTYEGGRFFDKSGIDKNLPFRYQSFWEAPTFLLSKIENALFLGGGAYAMPQLLSLKLPKVNIDVVEIDPKLIEVGREYFNLDDYDKIKNYASDARFFLRHSNNKYDFIFGDAYQGVKNIPSHLVTREFFAEVKANLAEEGIFFMNIISAIRGEKGKLFQSLMKTLALEFEHVNVFYVIKENFEKSQNLIIMASDFNYGEKIIKISANEISYSLLRKSLISPFSYKKLIENGEIFTDMQNSVEQVIAKQLILESRN